MTDDAHTFIPAPLELPPVGITPAGAEGWSSLLTRYTAPVPPELAAAPVAFFTPGATAQTPVAAPAVEVITGTSTHTVGEPLPAEDAPTRWSGDLHPLPGEVAVLATAPAAGIEATAVEPALGRRSLIAVAALTACVGIFVLAATVGGSSALLACAALFLVDVSAAMSVARHQPATTAFAAGAAVFTLWAAWGLMHQFSDMAFVAGLLVVVAMVPALLLSLASWLVLRPSTSAGDVALRAGTPLRAAALVVTGAAGVIAFNSFSARPDAIVCAPILALAGWRVLQVLRSRVSP